MDQKGVCSEQLELKLAAIPIFTIPASPAKPTFQAKPVPGPIDVLRASDVQDKSLEEKVSNATIRPPSIFIPKFHHAIPRALDSYEPSPTIATPATDVSHDDDIMSVSEVSQHPYYDVDYALKGDESLHASDDLADYLSHSISFHSEYDSPLDLDSGL